MSFLDALIPGSQKYDLHVKSISVPIEIQAGAVSVTAHGAIATAIGAATSIGKERLGTLQILSVLPFSIPSANVAAAPAVDATIIMQVPNQYAGIVINTVTTYRSTDSPNFSLAVVTKPVADNNITIAPLTGAAFPKPPNGSFLEITGFGCFGI